MSTLPLAIYTATHGLSWNYPRGEISFAELDACRKALCPLPDFDAGDAGYEGVWVTKERVFFLHCQSASAWDFRGRDATYLAVTWVPRDEVCLIDIDSLLKSPELCVPNRNPALFFDFAIKAQARDGLSVKCLPTMLSDGFRSVGALITILEPDQTAKFRRKLTEQVVSCRYEVVSHVLQQDLNGLPQIFPKPAITQQELSMDSPVTVPTQVKRKNIKQLKVALVFAFVTLLLSLIMNVWLGLPYLKKMWQDITCDKNPTSKSIESDAKKSLDEVSLEKKRPESSTTASVGSSNEIKDECTQTTIEDNDDEKRILNQEPTEASVDEVSQKKQSLETKETKGNSHE